MLWVLHLFKIGWLRSTYDLNRDAYLRQLLLNKLDD